MILKITLQDIISNIISNYGEDCIVKLDIKSIRMLKCFNKYPVSKFYENVYSFNKGYIKIKDLANYLEDLSDENIFLLNYTFDTYTQKVYISIYPAIAVYYIDIKSDGTISYDNVLLFEIITNDSFREKEMYDIINNMKTYDFKIDLVVDSESLIEYLNNNNKNIHITRCNTDDNKNLTCDEYEEWKGRFEVEGSIKTNIELKHVDQEIMGFFIDDAKYLDIIDFIDLKER
jgi:hypothetical protein